jgi:hypothetical protein
MTFQVEVYFDNIGFWYEGDLYGGDEYKIVYTATGWDTATYLPATTYGKICNVYATTLSSIDFGSGELIFDFATNIGVDTGLTWTIDTDVFRADVNTDYSRIGSVMRGKGTKLCTGTIHSFVADNTYQLEVSTIGDTFLRSAATAGADTIYVYDNTRFGTAYGYGSDFILVLDHDDTCEVVRVTATGANGACTLSATTTYAHTANSDVMNQGTFYATGEVDNFLTALEGIRTGDTLQIFIGSERLLLNTDTGTSYEKLTDDTVKLFMETLYRDDTTGYAYPHATGAPVYPSLYLGYPVADPNSLIAQYGKREAYVNPVGIVDPDTMDKLCYHTLMTGTPNGTWGRVMMPASLLPSTVDIGDWVNIAEADSSATNCYQIVGLEYDQRKGMFTIELGSTEDYYLGSIASNRGTFDLSLSNV